MSYPYSPHSYPQEPSRSRPTSLSQFPPSSVDASALLPPPPPPKPTNHELNGSRTPQTGPPILPLPPTVKEPQDLKPSGTKYIKPGSQSLSDSSQLPSLEDDFLPKTLASYSKTDLHTLLATPALLQALAVSPTTAHPSVASSIHSLYQALRSNAQLAIHILAFATDLSHQRKSVSSQLLHLHALERQWRLKQTALDTVLEPFSPKALHQRLVASIAEQEGYCKVLEESFWEGEGKAGEREVADFVKRWREGRKLLRLRKERRARFEEGRVGGWR